MCNAPQEQFSELQHQEMKFLMPPFSALLTQFHSLRSAVSDRSLRHMPQEHR